MNFIISTSVILKNLQSISGALSTNTVLPIVECFLFNIQDGKMTLSTTDLETSMTTQLTIDSNDTGKVAVPGKQLLEILKNCSEQPLTFHVDTETYNIEITSDNGKYKLMGEDGDNFPKIAEAPENNTFELSSSILHNAFNKTFFAIGTDEIRPAMTGMYMRMDAEGITFVSTDAHRLVKYVRTDKTFEGSNSFIIPRKTVGILKGIFGNNENGVKVAFDKNNVYFDNDKIIVACRLIDAKYPDFDAVIPTENPNILNIATHDLLGALKRVVIFSNKTTNLVSLKFAGSKLHVRGEDLDFSNEGDEEINCTYNGEDMAIGFNAKFLIEMLDNMNSQNINFEMSSPSRAGIIKPDTTTENESTLMLIMPIMLNNNY